MTKLITQLTKVMRLIASHFPSKLPTGGCEFDKFFSSICQLYDFPEENSYKQAVCTMIMHLNPLCTRKAKYYFVRSIRKSQANQVAYHKLQEIKDSEKVSKGTPSEPLQ